MQSFLVIFPAIAQDLVNQQEIQLHHASLLQPSPEQLTFSINSTITVPKPFTVVLDPLNLSLFVRDYKPITPYFYVEIPKNKLHGNASIKMDPQRITIANQSRWINFLHEFVYEEKLTIGVKGKTTGHFGAIKAKLKIDKNVKLRGEQH
jgi:hypothetical protein